MMYSEFTTNRFMASRGLRFLVGGPFPCKGNIPGGIAEISRPIAHRVNGLREVLYNSIRLKTRRLYPAV